MGVCGYISLLVVMQIAYLSAHPDTPQWPLLGRFADHTFRASVPGASNGVRVWIYNTGRETVTVKPTVRASPVIGPDGTIYVGSDASYFDSWFFALNGEDGSLKWRFHIEWGEVFSAAAIGDDGTIYVSTTNSYLYALNSADGSLRWRFAFIRSLWTSPTVGPNNTVLVPTGDQKLYALNGSDGSLKWSFQAFADVGIYPQSFISTPAISADGTMYFGKDRNPQVYALHGDGSFKWQMDSSHGADADVAPSIASDGTIFIGFREIEDPGQGDIGVMRALSPHDGSIKWQYKFSNPITSTAAVSTDGTIYFGVDDGLFYALNGMNGSLKWSINLGAIIHAPAIASDGTVFAGSDDGFVYALDGVNGSVKWRAKAGWMVESAPAIGADGSVYIGSRDGNVYRIGLTATYTTAVMDAAATDIAQYHSERALPRLDRLCSLVSQFKESHVGSIPTEAEAHVHEACRIASQVRNNSSPMWQTLFM